MSNIGEFVVECGVLTQYNGKSENLIIPDNVESIDDFVFLQHNEIKNVFISSSLTLIESYTFFGFDGLDSIVVDEKNPVYYSVDNCVIEKATKKLVLGCNNSIIPSDGSVISIADNAFNYQNKIKNLTLPCTIEKIGNFSFSGCESLETVFIPSSVASIGRFAFSDCNKLSKIEVDSKNPYFYSKDNCVIDKKENALIFGCNKSIIPKNELRYIEHGAFSECFEIQELIIPSSIRAVGNSAFFKALQLERVVIEEGVLSLCDRCFMNCYNLESVTIPNSLEIIGESTFEGCESLKRIFIPETVYSIGKDAFKDCPELVIEAEDDSYAQDYAIKNEIKLEIK